MRLFKTSKQFFASSSKSYRKALHVKNRIDNIVDATEKKEAVEITIDNINIMMNNLHNETSVAHSLDVMSDICSLLKELDALWYSVPITVKNHYMNQLLGDATQCEWYTYFLFSEQDLDLLIKYIWHVHKDLTYHLKESSIISPLLGSTIRKGGVEFMEGINLFIFR